MSRLIISRVRSSVPWLVVAFLSGSVATAIAQTPAGSPSTARPQVGAPKPFKPALRVERTLPNGLHVVVARHATVPKVSLTLTIRSGLAADPSGSAGLAALTADAIQEGTAGRTSQQIRQEVFRMGGSLSAAAGQDSTSVSLRGLSEFLPGLIDLLADVVVRPSFPEEEIAILKANELQALQRQKSSPQFVSNREFRQALFDTHPYARVTTTPETLKGIDRARIADFHRAHYRPNQAFLLVVGDVQPEAVFAAALKSFGGWERKDVVTPSFPALPPLGGREVIFVQRPGSIQSSVSIGNFAVKRTDPAWFGMLVANTIYGGAFNSRIVRNIREEKGYTYSPASQFAAFADAGFYRFAADVRNEVTGPAITEVYKEIDRMRAEGADGPELEGAKQYLRGVFVIQNGTQGGLSNVLGTVYTFGLPKDYLETYQSRVTAIGPADVKAASERLLGSENSILVIVGDYGKVKDQLAGFRGVTFLDLDGKKLSGPPESN